MNDRESTRTHLSGVAATALAAAISTLAVPSAQAIQFNWGEVDGTFTSTWSLGSSWRLDDPDPDFVSPGNTNGEGRASASVTDDGNLNFEKGDQISFIFKGRHDLELSYKNFGTFIRFKYWYDQELEDGKRPHGNSLNGYAPDEALDDSGFSDFAKASGVELLDAYVYGSFDIGDIPLDLRLGNQVVSWGESTFIQNGVNVINPVDVSALRRPGSELKDALLPVNLFYASAGLTQNLSVEAFYQIEWEKTELDACGTYFATADVAADGCEALTLFSTYTDKDMYDRTHALGALAPGIITRADDNEPDDSGQWGIAFRYFAEELNSTEFGVYYVNYHSRTPVFGGVNDSNPALLGQSLLSGSRPQYIMEFPEDIEVFAFSFATYLGSVALSGELSHRPEMPIAINTTEIVHAIALANLAPWSKMQDRAIAAGPGGIVHGYDELEFTQLQLTMVKFFDRVLGASRLSLAAEVGANWIGSMPGDDTMRYGRSPTFGIGEFTPFDSGGGPGALTSCEDNQTPVFGGLLEPNTIAKNCTDDGYLTDFAWGYRIRAGLEYNDVYKGISLKPAFAFSHDVEGTSPAPNFIEGSKAVSLSLEAIYLNKYSAKLAITDFFGGDYSVVSDRDFVSLSAGYSF